ncbi:MAG: acyltransferase [Roseiflexaceae bacterium]|nr:acyltransferase [Roseiflexaceae bacterium]
MSDAIPNDTPQQLPVQRSFIAKMKQILSEDTSGLHPRLLLVELVLKLFPQTTANHLRAGILDRTGFGIGAGTLVRGTPRINGTKNIYQNLSIGVDCLIDPGCTFDLMDRITIGDRVTIGHQTMILTSSHEIGTKEQRAGAVMQAPVIINNGVWIGPRSIILPGITIGEGAVIAAGTLVNKDVAAHTRVAGTPAKVVETLTVE